MASHQRVLLPAPATAIGSVVSTADRSRSGGRRPLRERPAARTRDGYQRGQQAGGQRPSQLHTGHLRSDATPPAGYREFRPTAPGQSRLSPPPGVRPNFSGLSGRFEEMPAARGLVLSLLIVAAGGANPDAFRAVIEDIVSVIAKSPDMSNPVPLAGLRLSWPSAGAGLGRAPHATLEYRWSCGGVPPRTDAHLLFYLAIRDSRWPLRAGDLSSASGREFRFP